MLAAWAAHARVILDLRARYPGDTSLRGSLP